MSDSGHIELERQVDSLRIGVRHRTELGATKTIRRRISDGTIPAYQCGRRPIRIRLEDLEAALRRIPSTRW